LRTHDVTQQQETQATSEVGTPPTPPAVVGGWPRMVVATAGLVVGAVAVYTIGMDAFWPTFVGAVVTAVLTFAAAAGLSRAARPIGRHMKVTQVAVVLVLALAVGLFYRSVRNDAFRESFGVLPPDGVSHVDVVHLLGKEAGRKLTVVEFEASRTAFDALLAERSFVQDPRAHVKPGKEAKAQRSLWARAFVRYGTAVEDRWKNRLPVTDPLIFHWQGKQRGLLDEQTSVLWDADSGRGCAIHSSE
jgi:hypothetical protein